MPPIEGRFIKGSADTGSGNSRTIEEVNAEFVALHNEITARGGKILVQETVFTPLNWYSTSGQRQDTHYVIDFSDQPDGPGNVGAEKPVTE